MRRISPPRRSNTVNVNFTGASAADMAFESWWFYRVSGGTLESPFANPDIELYNGSVGRLGWNDPTGSGLFDAALSFEVFDSGTGGNLFQNLRIQNTSGASLTIDIFHYSDFDLAGTSGSDRADPRHEPGRHSHQSDRRSADLADHRLRRERLPREPLRAAPPGSDRQRASTTWPTRACRSTTRT